MLKKIKPFLKNLSFAFFKSGPECVQLLMSLREFLIGVIYFCVGVSLLPFIQKTIFITELGFRVKMIFSILIGTFGLIGLSLRKFEINLIFVILNSLFFLFLAYYTIIMSGHLLLIIDYITFALFSVWLLYRTIYDRITMERK